MKSIEIENENVQRNLSTNEIRNEKTLNTRTAKIGTNIRSRIARIAIVNIPIGTMIAIFAALLLSPYNLTNLASTQGPPTIKVNLTGSEEVPPVQTGAAGVAEFIVGGTDSIGYSVKATNIEGATAGHVHLGAKGVNGPVVVTLFKYDTPMNEVSENGTITADKLEGPLAGKQISDLAAAGANGTLYVNVHTEQNPNGEIRGQGGNPTMQ
jgi:CHRD domain